MNDDYTRPDEHQQAYGPIAIFRERGIMPPSGVYITQDDVVQLRGWAPSGAQTVRVTLRILNNAGIVVPAQTTIVVAANGATATVQTVSADEGFLISASIDGDAITRGLCFVQLLIRRGLGSGDSSLGQVVCQGYVSIYDQLTFPNGPMSGGVDGRGAMRIVTGTNPAAGAQVSETVPAGREWIVRAVAIPIVTDATAGARFPVLQCDDGAGAIVAQSIVAGGLGASQTVTINWAAGFNVQAGPTVFSYPFAMECRLRAGWRVQTSCAPFNAGDDWGAPRLLVEEFISQ